MRGRAAYFPRRCVRICLRSFICYTGLFRIRFVTTEERRPKTEQKTDQKVRAQPTAYRLRPHLRTAKHGGGGKNGRS
jgi:hypothetical protein